MADLLAGIAVEIVVLAVPALGLAVAYTLADRLLTGDWWWEADCG